MNSLSALIYIILAACLLPYVFSMIARLAGGFKQSDHQHPRQFLNQTQGLAARAHAVQQNSFESLPLFIAAMLMSEYLVMPKPYAVLLGLMYLLLRLVYGIVYLVNWANLRSIVWFFSMLCPVLLLLLTARAFH